MKKILIIFLVLVLLGGGGYLLFGQKNINPSSETKLGTESNNLYKVQKGGIIKTISSNGYINPKMEKDLTFMSSGNIKEIKVNQGDLVSKDELIATLDNLSEELAVIKAENSYKQAKISSTETVIKEKYLELQIAKQNLQNTFLYAPFSGILASVDLEVNDQVNSNTSIGYLYDNTNYIIELNIDEVDISQMEIGQMTIVTLDAYSNVILRGTISEIGLVAENNNGVITIPVTIELTNVDSSIRPGLSATADIIVAQAKDVVIVPLTAITSNQNGTFVQKKIGDKVESVQVTTGVSNDLMIAILDGLSEGDEIVVNNYQALEAIKNQSGMGGFSQRGMMMPIPGSGTKQGGKR